MDTRQFEKTSETHSRKARMGWWIGLAVVVVLAAVVHVAYRPARATDAAPPAETIAMAAPDASAGSAEAVSGAVPHSAMPRELVEMEAAGLVTLTRPGGPSAAPRPAFPRELVEMEAAGLVTLTRP
ncbi:MAG: hypothetical protein U0768_08955 [Anaerolineae bacterium]